MKTKLLINLLLITIFIANIISFSLIIPFIIDNLDTISTYLSMDVFESEFEREVYLQALRYNASLKTISIVFSTIAAIASAIAFVLINYKLFGKKDNKTI